MSAYFPRAEYRLTRESCAIQNGGTLEAVQQFMQAAECGSRSTQKGFSQMGSVNKVILVGNLGRDAELRYTPGGSPVATINLATTEVWNDKAGQRQEKTEWHRVVLWGKTAESLNEYLTKGKQIYVEGRLQTRQWDDKDGNKRYTTEIRGDRIVLLAEADGRAAAADASSRAPAPAAVGRADDRARLRAHRRRYSVLAAGSEPGAEASNRHLKLATGLSADSERLFPEPIERLLGQRRLGTLGIALHDGLEGLAREIGLLQLLCRSEPSL